VHDSEWLESTPSCVVVVSVVIQIPRQKDWREFEAAESADGHGGHRGVIKDTALVQMAEAVENE